MMFIQSGMRQRKVGGGAAGGNATGSSGMLRFYTEDSPGLRVYVAPSLR